MNKPAILDLLCDCLAPPSGGEFASKPADLTPRDWGDLLLQAQSHGLGPLLQHRLRSRCPDLQIPPDTAKKLKKSVHIGVGRSLWLFKGLSRILRALNSAGVPVIVLKGAHLAPLVYCSIELRQMRDVDILIPVPHLMQAVGVIEALGYAPVDEFKIEETLTRSQHLPLFIRDGEIPVEIHWTIERPTSPFRIDVEGLWHRSRPVTVEGEAVRILSPEDLLLHLCLHAGYHHRFIVSLQVFADIAEIVRHHGDQFDWTGFEVRCGKWGVTRPAHLCLHMAKELVNSAVPQDMLQRLEPADFEPAIVSAAREQLQVFSMEGPRVPLLSNRHARLWGVDWPYLRPSFWIGRYFLPQRSPARYNAAAPDSGQALGYHLARIRDFLLKIVRGGRYIMHNRQSRKAVAQREQFLGSYITRRE